MKDSDGVDRKSEDKLSGSQDRPGPQVREEERHHEQFERAVGDSERRKVRARRRREDTVWFGLGTFGLIGWSVAIPTLICLWLGVWLDRNYPQGFSWTLTLIFMGIIIGCLNAWYWLSREREEISEAAGEPDSEDEHGV